MLCEHMNVEYKDGVKFNILNILNILINFL